MKYKLPVAIVSACLLAILIVFGYFYFKNGTVNIFTGLSGDTSTNGSSTNQLDPVTNQKRQEQITQSLENSNKSQGLPEPTKSPSDYTAEEKKALADLEKKNQEILKQLEASIKK